MEFDVEGIQNLWCAATQPFCALEIRKLARWIKISCLLKWHAIEYDPTTGPD